MNLRTTLKHNEVQSCAPQLSKCFQCKMAAENNNFGYPTYIKSNYRDFWVKIKTKDINTNMSRNYINIAVGHLHKV